MKFGICSEIFKDWNDIARTVNYVKEVGYDGLEIAPFTFSPYVTDISAQTRAEIVNRAAEADLDILGIHWGSRMPLSDCLPLSVQIGST